jgi:flagellar biosynthesis/type III secretory pathway M-ring protein FliF/YscJ
VEPLKRMLNQVQGQLNGMTLSQRLVIALCMVVLVGASVWLLRWSGEPALVPLLDQSFSAEELAAAQHRLELTRVSFEVKDDRLWVPPGDRARLIALLKEADALPDDIGTGFDELIEEASPWLPEKERSFQRMVARGNELTRVIRNFHGVHDARVILGAETQPGFRQAGSPITATVTLWLKPSFTADKRFMTMVASTVAGATPGLEVGNVHVIDATNGKSFRVSKEAQAASDELFDQKLQLEQHYAESIRQHLASFVPGVIVGVFAEISFDAQRSEARKVDKPVVARERTSETRETQSAGGAEPGVVPNVGTALAPQGSAQNSLSKTSETEYVGSPSEEISVTVTDKGALVKLSASVSVPNSYLVKVFRESSGQEPAGDGDLDPLRTRELDRIRQVVMPLIDATSEKQVQVAWFYDTPEPMPALAGVDDGAVKAVLGSYGKPVGLAGLAVISLLLMLMMVRRGFSGAQMLQGKESFMAQAPLTPSAGSGARRPLVPKDVGSDQQISAGSGPLGSAATSTGVLEGQEVDEQTIRVHQMSQQVSQMVREDPESAAALLQRWIERR